MYFSRAPAVPKSLESDANGEKRWRKYQLLKEIVTLGRELKVFRKSGGKKTEDS